MNFDNFYNSNPNLKLKILRDLVLKYKGFITGAETNNDISFFGTDDIITAIQNFQNSKEFQSFKNEIDLKNNATDSERFLLEKFIGSMMGSYLTHDLLTNPSVFYDHPHIKEFTNAQSAGDILKFGGLSDSLTVLFQEIGEGENFPDILLKDSADNRPYDIKDICRQINVNENKLLDKISFIGYPKDLQEKIVHDYNISIGAIDLYPSSPKKSNSTNQSANPDNLPEEVPAIYTIKTFADFLANNPQKMPLYCVDLHPENIINPGINESPGNPTVFRPNLSSFIIRKNINGKGSRNDNYLSIFFQAVSQLELSRCSPFLSLTFYNKTAKTNDNNNPHNLDNIGFMRFNKNSKGLFEGFLNHSVEKIPNFIDNEKEKLNSISYMDIFTSPQTMVNANINNVANESFFDMTNDNKSHLTELSQNVLDPFAPMMSLKSFNATINGGGDFMITNRRAKLSFVLHDRSRLKDISPLISLNELRKTVVKVEHGWFHPDGNPIKSNNDIGKFLNSMRETHIYQLTDSSFSFSGNEVTINMTLDFFGATDFKTAEVYMGNEKKADKLINKLVEVIDDMEKNNRITDNLSDDSGQQSILNLYGPAKTKQEKNRINTIHKSIKILRNAAESITYLMPIQDIREIELKIEKISKAIENEEIIETYNHAEVIFEFFKKLKLYEASEDAGELSAEDLIALLETEDGITDQLFERIKKTSAERIFSKINSITDSRIVPDGLRGEFYNVAGLTNDPFQNEACNTFASGIINQDFYPRNSISLGKLITNLIALPMLNAGEENKYSEVQVIYYPINSSAAGARKYTTASIPVDIQAVKSMIAKNVKDKSDTTIRGIFDLLSNYFQNDNLPIYGLTDLNDSNIKKKEEEIKKEKDFKKNAYNKFKIAHGKEPADEKQKEAAEDSYLKSRLKSYKQKTLSSKLTEIYSYDGIGLGSVDSYKKPIIHMEFEVLSAIIPNKAEAFNSANVLSIYTNNFKDKFDLTDEEITQIKGIDDNKKILKIHVYDENSSSRPAETLFMEGLTNPSDFLSIAGTLNNFNPDNNNEDVINAFKKEVAGKVNLYFKKMSTNELKRYIKRSMPSITYGSQQAVVKQINVSSNTSDEIINARLNQAIYEQEQRDKGIANKSSEPQIEFSETVVPTSIDITLYGCPFITMGLNLFIDLNTGTDIDNIYMVGDVSHTIGPGDYSTQVSLYLPNMGSVKSLKSSFEKAIDSIDIEKFKENLGKVKT